MTKRQKRGWHGLLVVLSMILLLTACTSKAAKAVEKVELGQKYLTEQNYTEAVASFTEAIGLDPENIPAYMGRAQAYMALGEYEKALKDYQFVSSRTEKCRIHRHFPMWVRQKCTKIQMNPTAHYRATDLQRSC